jgi:multiple antibiotic resistance protein
MDPSLMHAVTVFMAFFAIMNPIAGVPVFLSLTSGDNEQLTKRVAVRSLMVAFTIIAIFSVAGKVIFDLFGLTLPAFQITGGIIIFIIGIHMLQGNDSSVQHPSDEDKQNSLEAALSVAISPLGTPLLAGPGTIATAMTFSTGGGISNMLVTISVFAVLCLITYFFFIFGGKLVTYLGTSALGVITRMMGLILGTIGTQMIIEGLRATFHLAG